MNLIIGASSGIDVASIDYDYVLAGVLKCLDQFEVHSSWLVSLVR